MEDKKRRMISDTEAENITGGLLTVTGTVEEPLLEWRNKDYQLIRTYRIKPGCGGEVMDLMKSMYFNFAPGTEDQQMLNYLGQNGYIRPM